MHAPRRPLLPAATRMGVRRRRRRRALALAALGVTSFAAWGADSRPPARAAETPGKIIVQQDDAPTEPAAPASPAEALRAQEAALVELSEIATAITAMVEVFLEVRADGSEPSRRFVPVTYSGIVLTEDGYIATVADALELSDYYRVTLAGGQVYDAEVAVVDGRRCIDHRTNIALLKIEAEGLTPATFAASSDVRRGQFLLSCGSAFGLDGTISTGIVTGTNRTLWFGQTPFFGVIQTNCDVNAGDPGGLAVDSSGDVVGMLWSTFTGGYAEGVVEGNGDDEGNRDDGDGEGEGDDDGDGQPKRQQDGSPTEEDSDSEGGSDGHDEEEPPADAEQPSSEDGATQEDGEADPDDPRDDLAAAVRQFLREQARARSRPDGINFILPAETVQHVASELLAYGHVRRMRLGVRAQELRNNEGVIIFYIMEGGAAEAAGLQRLDRIVGFDGEDVRTFADLFRFLRGCTPDDGPHVLAIKRGGELLDVEVTLREAQD